MNIGIAFKVALVGLVLFGALKAFKAIDKT